MTPRRDFVHVRISPSSVDVPMLYRFVLASLLLHALVLITFGTATTSGARSGESPWSVLDVTLRRLSPEPGSGILLAPGADSGSPGAALLRRLGGPRSTTPAPVIEDRPAEPSATRNATPIESAPAAIEAPRPVDVPQSPTPTARVQELPPINREAPEEVDRRFAPVPQTPPRIERAPAPHVEAPPRELPTPAAPQPVERVAPPPVEREIAPAVEPPPREVPTPAAPLPASPAPPPKVEREVGPAVETQRATPVPPVAEPIAPKLEPTVAPPVAVPPPRIAPAESISPERVAPKIEREAPAPAAPTPRNPSVEAAPRIERVAPPAAVPGKPSAAPPPARTEVPPGDSPPRLRFGAPDPGDEIFKSRGEIAAPGADSGSPPRLDLDATRQRTREIASEGVGYRGFVPALPPPPPVDRKSKLAESIDKAQKPDCRDAYANMGLLAVPALVASTVANGGCRW